MCVLAVRAKIFLDEKQVFGKIVGFFVKLCGGSASFVKPLSIVSTDKKLRLAQNIDYFNI